MERLKWLVPAGIPVLALVACIEGGETTPCDDYVDYICSCHADDDRPGYDCDTLRVTYQNADPTTQDECQLALDDQIAEDEAEGYACAGDTGL